MIAAKCSTVPNALRRYAHFTVGLTPSSRRAGQSGTSDSCARNAPDDGLFQSSAFSYNQLGNAASAFGRLQAGEGGILAIIGEAGIGKSRLLAELRREHLSEHLPWLEGHALSYGQSISYMPFHEILRISANIDDEDDEGIARHKLETHLRTELVLDALGTTSSLSAPAQYFRDWVTGWRCGNGALQRSSTTPTRGANTRRSPSESAVATPAPSTAQSRADCIVKRTGSVCVRRWVPSATVMTMPSVRVSSPHLSVN